MSPHRERWTGGLGLASAAAILIFGWMALRVATRWQEEALDRQVVLVADYSEVRDDALRQGLKDSELLSRLMSAGIQALLLSPSTINEYLSREMAFPNRQSAQVVLEQMTHRGIVGISLAEAGRPYRLVSSRTPWTAMKDLELGFDPDLVMRARQAGFRLVFRINQDPWMSSDALFSELAQLEKADPEYGVLLNSDDLPGDESALSAWADFLKTQKHPVLLFEFRPAKSALKVARRAPASVFRAHTIASTELKDMTAAKEWARWSRALRERSCRFLLIHISPRQTLTGFFEHVFLLRQELLHQGWQMIWPEARLEGEKRSSSARRLAPLLSLLLAMAVPVVALRLGLGESPWKSFFQIVFYTLVGACVMSAVADQPLTRLEIVPFRGVKLAFIAAWVGCLGVLYPRTEWRALLDKSVQRWEILAGIVLAGCAGYLLIRTGNAGAGWSHRWELLLRDHLEGLFVARPRFKEFAIGYPLLILGLHLWKSEKWNEAGRFLTAIGMVGPISMVNTFCHLHTPVYLAFWRSAAGIVVGVILGQILLRGTRPWRS